MSTGRPLRTSDRALVGLGVAFTLLIALGGGLGLAAEGFEGRTALAPTDRQCGKESCGWIDTFSSTDGTVTARDVELRDDVEVSRDEPMPGAIDGVRLGQDAGTACTADYGRRAPVAKGAALGVVGLAVAAGLVLMPARLRGAGVSP